MVNRRYMVVFETQPDGGYHASCPVLPGCHSEGDTLDEATSNIREAIELCVESMIAHGETPKLPSIRARDVVRVAESIGFALHRQRGSHAVYLRASDKRRVVVPMHGS